jgi:beta-xylosidase
MGVVVAPGKYNFSKVIASWRYQKSLGVTPIVETSFMPAVLAGCSWKNPNPPGATTNPGKHACQHTGMEYRGIQVVPTEWADWYDLVKALTQAAVDTFGIEEIRTWSFECWSAHASRTRWLERHSPRHSSAKATVVQASLPSEPAAAPTSIMSTTPTGTPARC